jgi:hypothetical protein
MNQPSPNTSRLDELCQRGQGPVGSAQGVAGADEMIRSAGSRDVAASC